MTAAGHGDGDSDSGFTLVETMVSVFVIGVVMAALTTFFVTSVSLSSHQGAIQAATQLATEATGRVRTMRGSLLITGRDATSSQTQWNNAVPGVAPYLADMVLASDTTAAAGAGVTAALPTVPKAPVRINDVDYSTHYYVGSCWQPAGGGPCGKTPIAGAATYYRVVVAITWRGRTCAQSACSYVTSTLVSNVAYEPLFNVNGPATTSVRITSPGNRSGVTGSAVSLQLAATNGTPPLTWSFRDLPPGLSGSAAGLISGTLPGTPDVHQVVATVRDALGNTDSTNFTWTVTRPLPPNATGFAFSRPCTAVPTAVPAVRAVSTASGAAGATVVDVGTPATQAGDVLVAVVLSTRSGNPVTPGVPGWTAAPLRRGTVALTGPVSSAASKSAHVYWRAVTGPAPATYRFGWPDGTDSGTVLLASYRGADLSDPLGTVYVTEQSGGTGITGESLPVTTAPGAYLLATMTSATPPQTATATMTSTDPALAWRGTVAAANGAGRLTLWEKVYPGTGSTGTPPVAWAAPARPGLAFSAVLRQRTTPYVDPTVSFTWTPPADTAVTGYELTNTLATTALAGRTTAGWTDTTTTATGPYVYTLRSVSANGRSSGVSVNVPACP